MNLQLNVRKIALLISLAAMIGACSGKKESTEAAAESEPTNWQAMDDYHMIMAESYHPLKDSANLEPAKANAQLLAAEAEKWAETELPERVNNDEMKAKIESIKTNSRAFADKVLAGAPDEELAAALTALHEEYHHVMEAWEGGHSEHH